MSKGHSGFRKNTRDKLKKRYRQKSKFNLNRFLQTFKAGDKVLLKIEPSFHRGMFLPRFQGLTGVVHGTRGRCYEVITKDGNKGKKLLVHPAHLKRL